MINRYLSLALIAVGIFLLAMGGYEFLTGDADPLVPLVSGAVILALGFILRRRSGGGVA